MSINAVSTMRSQRPKSATAKSYLANDTRYSHLHEAYVEPYLGPGCYDLSYSAPALGLLPLDHPTAGATPSLDPFRMSRSFLSPARPASPVYLKASDAPDTFYIDPTFRVSYTLIGAAVVGPVFLTLWALACVPRVYVALCRSCSCCAMCSLVLNSTHHVTPIVIFTQPASPKGIPWSEDTAHRPDIVDWRYASRYRDAKREVCLPPEAGEVAVDLDAASRPVEVSKRAALKNPHVSAFTTKEVRASEHARADAHTCAAHSRMQACTRTRTRTGSVVEYHMNLGQSLYRHVRVGD